MTKKARNTSGITFRSTPPKAILFGAVSSGVQAEPDKVSLEDQFKVLREAMTQLGAQVIDEIEIPGFSRDFYNYRDFVNAAAQEGITAPARMFDHWRKRDFDLVAVLNFSRLGREEGIVHDFVGQTYGIGSFIYTQKNGLIAPENRRVVTMIEAYGSKSEVDEIVRRHHVGMRSRVERGLHAGNKLPHFHRYTFGPDGKPQLTTGRDGKVYYLTVDPAKYRLLDDLYDLYVHQHTPVDFLELELAKRGHLRPDGKPHKRNVMMNRIWQAAFHGHLGYGMTILHKRWMIDETYRDQAPPDARMHYHVCEPCYAGQAGVIFRQEMYRRIEMQGGKAQPYRCHTFTGLLVCGECGYALVYRQIKQGAKLYSYYHCHRHDRARRHGHLTPCSQYHSIPAARIQTYVDAWLRTHFAPDSDIDMHLAALYPAQHDTSAQLAAEIDALTRRIDGLMSDLEALDPGSPSRRDFIARHEALTRQRDTLQAQYQNAQNGDLARLEHARLIASMNIVQRLDAGLWNEDETAINATLYTLLHGIRFVCKDGQVVGTVRR